ncbi:MAG TPA: NAD(P)H-dependent oxidoreductase [Myxococcales bacterium]|nr:NAD(P)H-dependent oxidoreductase [Myxococcales bacterium]
MADQVRIAAVAGALRQASNNRKLLALAVREAEKAGAVVEVLDLKALALPVYDQDIEDAAFPEPVLRLKEALARAQGLIISTPEYNHSIPGGLKNAIDWASRPTPPPNPFRDKVVLVMGATPGPGGTIYAQSHLRETLVGLGAWLLPGSIHLSQADGAFDERGELREESKRKQMTRLVPLLVQAARQGVPKI